MTIFVIKRDNRIEEFDLEKLKKAIVEAGASEDLAAKIACTVEEDVGRVASCSIRDKAIRLLKIGNPDIASSFETFKKPKVQ